MNARLSQSLTVLITGILLVGTGVPAYAQNTRGINITPATPPPLPPGGNWRPVNPQPINPGQQQFNLQSTLLLRSGDIVAASYRSSNQVYVGPGETRQASLTIDSALRDPRGNVIVPAGAVIQGQFQPASGGTQFVARSIAIGNQSYPLSAQSSVIANQRDPRETSGEAIAGDAAIGLAGAAILSGLFGDRVLSTEKLLGGAAAGAVIGNVTAPEVAVVRADTPLNLTVTQDFQPLLR